MGWIVLLPSLAVWRVLSKRIKLKGKGKKGVNVAVMVTAFVAGCGLSLTWLAGVFVWPFSLLPSGGVRIGLSAAAVILAVGVMIGDIAGDKQADRPAQWAAFLAPTFLMLLAGGVVGAAAGDVRAEVIGQVGQFFSQLGDS